MSFVQTFPFSSASRHTVTASTNVATLLDEKQNRGPMVFTLASPNAVYLALGNYTPSATDFDIHLTGSGATATVDTYTGIVKAVFNITTGSQRLMVSYFQDGNRADK
jgi:hypothetical protein